MKKVFLVLALSAFSTLGFSQSKWLIDGNLSLGTTSSDVTITNGGTSTTTQQPSTFTFGIGVNAAYMVTDHLAIGLGIGFDLDKTTDESVPNTTTVDKTNTFSLLPQVHYFLPLSDKFVYAPALYIAIGFGGESTETTVGSVSNETTGDLFGFGVELQPLSFDFHLTDNIALHLGAGSISFMNTTYTTKPMAGYEYKASASGFGIVLNPNITLGFRLFF
ncbi:MAG: porin family protein [Bacteroidales bacterium]|jgi:hypothetical protein|nr:porin family protein [Bacteroidales bacterium]